MFSSRGLGRTEGLAVVLNLFLCCLVNSQDAAKMVISPMSLNLNTVRIISKLPANAFPQQQAADAVGPTIVQEPLQQLPANTVNTPVKQQDSTNSVNKPSGTKPKAETTNQAVEQQEISTKQRQQKSETKPETTTKSVQGTPETQPSSPGPEDNKNEAPITEAKVNKTGGMICQSKHCYKVAKSIRDALNTSVDPCDNFYEYACGTWIKEHKIPKFHSQYSRISELSNNNEQILMHALRNEETTDTPNLKKIKTFFQSCMDVDAIDKLGSKPLLDHIKGLGWWALDKKWKAKEWEFYDTLAEMHRKYPAEVFFTIDVHADPTKRHDKSEFLIMIDQATLNLPQIVYFTSPKIVRLVSKYMTDIITLIGYKREDAKTRVNDIIKFEAKLALISVPKILKKYVRVPLKKLVKAVPEFPWEHHLKMVFAPKPVTMESKVIVLANDYLPKLFELLKKTNKDTLSDYMVWRLVKDVVPLLSKDYRSVHYTLKKRLLGVKHDKPRDKKCFGYTNNILGPLMGALFVRNAFSPESKQKVETMMKGIIKAFEGRVSEVGWIDKQTVESVKEKADAAVYKVGFPDYLWDEKQFNARYDKLNITDGHHWFQNVLETDKFASLQTYQKLDTVCDKHHWITVPHLVNAFYVITKNEIVIPAGILQPPFFYPEEIPRSISYGAIGHVLGHELTHGFDTTGRKFDKNGEEIEKRSSAWSKPATEMFEKKAKCLVDQFSKYKVLGKFHLSGEKTLGENIADGGGVKLAFRAFKQYLKEHGHEETLPLIDMPSDKLFFLGYAQKECVHTTPAAEFLSATEDVHPPSKYRVIGTLSNLNEFSEVYKCKEGSFMNPKKKCQVW